MAFKIVWHCKKDKGDGTDVWWWSKIAFKSFPEKMAELLQADLEYVYYDPFDENDRVVRKVDCDIAFVHTGLRCKEKPGKFVFTFLSDTWHDHIPGLLDGIKPDLVVSLQQNPPESLVRQTLDFGGIYFDSYWCVDVPPYNPDRDLIIFSNETVNSAYPGRSALNSALNRAYPKNVKIQINKTDYCWKEPIESYHQKLSRTVFSNSGPIFDKYIPCKYYEIAAHGACLITTPSPFLESAGFTDENCFKVLFDGEQIFRLPDFCEKGTIEQGIERGKRARELIKLRHSVYKRAQEVINFWKELR